MSILSILSKLRSGAYCRVWFLGLALILAALSYQGGIAAQDRVPQVAGEPRWLAFDGQAAPAQPALNLIQAGTEAIDLAAGLPAAYRAVAQLFFHVYLPLVVKGP